MLDELAGLIHPGEVIHDLMAGPGRRLGALCDRRGAFFSGVTASTGVTASWLNVDLPISAGWQALLKETGYTITKVVPVYTRRYGGLDNADKRADHEVVIIVTKPMRRRLVRVGRS